MVAQPWRAGIERNKKRAIGNRKSEIFHVPLAEIRNDRCDLSISRYKQIEHKEIEYEKPGVIMKKVMRLEKEIENDIEAIKAMIR